MGKTYEAWEFDDVLRSMKLEEISKYTHNIETVPSAPFIVGENNKATNAYITLLLKKAVSAAIDNGQSSVSWTTAEQQADRYNLSKQVDTILWRTKKSVGKYVTIELRNNDEMPMLVDDNGIIIFDENGHNTNGTIGKRLDDYVGKDIADKIMASDKDSLSGDGLKVGGAWTKSMYGDEQGLNAKGQPSLITQAASTIAKKFGGKIDQVEILVDGKWIKQPALIITPEMRSKVLDEGMPLFSKREQPTPVSDQDNSIKFSRSQDSNSPSRTQEITSAIKEAIAPTNRNMPLSWLGGFFQRNWLIDFAEKALPMLKDYKKLSQQKENFIQKAEREVALKFESMEKSMSPGQMLELGRLQGLVTNLEPDEAFDPAEYDGDERDLNTRQIDILRTYRAQPEAVKNAYKLMRDDYRDDLRAEKSALIERIRAYPMDRITQDEIIKEISLRFDQPLKNGVYFPLSRFGNTIIVGKTFDANDNEIVHQRVVEYAENEKQVGKIVKAMQDQGYETSIMQRAAYNRMEAEQNASSKIVALATKAFAALETKHNQKDADEILDFSGYDPKDIIKSDEYLKILDDFNQLLIDALPDVSYRKHFKHRKGRLGYSMDTLRSYANTRISATKNIAGLLYNHKIADEIKAAEKAIKDMNGARGHKDTAAISSLLEEIKLRDQAMNDTKVEPWAQWATNLGFFGALGFNISSAAVNGLQVFQTTLPELAGIHGVFKAEKALRGAYKMLFSSSVLDKHSGFNLLKHPDMLKPENAALKSALTKLQDDGKIDLTMAHDAISMGQNPSYSESEALKKIHTVAKYAGYPFHVIEALNRQVTAIATFNLEYKKNGGDFEKAYDEAVRVIDATHFDYSTSNRMRYMMSNNARVLTLFKAYAAGMSYFIGRHAYNAIKGESREVRAIARKTLAVQMGMIFVTSGLTGLPIGHEAFALLGGISAFKYKGANPVVMAAGTVGGMLVYQAFLAGLGADDDDDLETDFRNWLSDSIGQKPAEWVTKGPMRLLPIGDISGRAGVKHLWWHPQNKELEGRDEYNAIMNALLGPLGSQAAGMFSAVSMYQDGNYKRAMEAMSPAVVRNIVAMQRLSSDGATNYSGDKLVEREMSYDELVIKLLGFNPTVIANASAANAAITKAKDKIDMERKHLVNRYLNAEDQQERTELMQNDIKEFNSQVKGDERITIKSIMDSKKRRKSADKRTKHGLYLGKKHEYLRDKGRFNEWE